MIREFLAETQLAIWPLAAFVLFFLTFTTVVLSIAIGMVKKRNFDHVAALPLESDQAAPHVRINHER